MQDEVQPEVERRVTPQETLRGLWTQLAGIPFWRQKNAIQMRPDLVPFAGTVRLAGWSSPLVFAIQGLAVAAVVLSLINWYITHDIGPRRVQIQALQNDLATEAARQQGIMDATARERNRIARSNQVFTSLSKEQAIRQMDDSIADSKKSLQEFKTKTEAKEKEVYAIQQAEALANSGTPLIFTLALIFAAGWVANGLQRDFPRNNVRLAGDLYLYFAAACGVWFNLALLALLHFALSGSSYGLPSAISPVIWVVFWIGFYILFAHYLASISRNLYKAMQIRPPTQEWDLENKMLMRLHNSFLIVFAALEAMFLSLSYLCYAALLRFS